MVLSSSSKKKVVFFAFSHLVLSNSFACFCLLPVFVYLFLCLMNGVASALPQLKKCQNKHGGTRG